MTYPFPCSLTSSTKSNTTRSASPQSLWSPSFPVYRFHPQVYPFPASANTHAFIPTCGASLGGTVKMRGAPWMRSYSHQLIWTVMVCSSVWRSLGARWWMAESYTACHSQLLPAVAASQSCWGAENAVSAQICGWTSGSWSCQSWTASSCSSKIYTNDMGVYIINMCVCIKCFTCRVCYYWSRVTALPCTVRMQY